MFFRQLSVMCCFTSKLVYLLTIFFSNVFFMLPQPAIRAILNYLSHSITVLNEALEIDPLLSYVRW